MFKKAGLPFWGAGLLVVVLVVGVLVWRHDRTDYVVPPPAERVVQAQATKAAAALSAFQQAVEARSGGASPALSALVANGKALDVEDLSLRYVDEAGAVSADGSWIGAVDLTYRFGGYDTKDVSEEVDARFGPDGQLTGFGGGDDAMPLWLSGPVQVRRTPETLVLTAGSADADHFGAMATKAVQVVDRVFPDWRGPLVVEVPENEAGLDALMGQPAGTESGAAAVTAPVGGGPVHVLVNPDVFGSLENRGAQVVLSHEATHAATNAVGNASRPPWLTEGFADYVALRDVRLPLSTTAGQILASVRKQGPPDHLPGPAEFNSKSDTFGMEYESAWFANRLLAQLGGEDKLVQLYDRAGNTLDLDGAMRRIFGFGLADFTKQWQAALTAAAQQSSP